MQNEKLDKQTKDSINYFQKSDTLKLIGGGILIAGLLALWIGWGWISFILAFIGTPTGLVLFFIGTANKMTDADIDSAIDNKMADLTIDIDNDRSYKLKLLPHQKDITLENYKFSDGVMLKRLKSGEIRTSEFSRTKMRILCDRLYMIRREISLIYNDQVQTDLFELFFDEILSVEVFRDQKSVIFNKNTFFIKPCELVITTKDCEFRFPCANAVTSDELVNTITRQMQNYKNANQ